MSSKILAGRYELFEKVGEGGMSVVYKAKDRLLNRFVAIKILKPEFVKDTKFIESFRRESQSAASLSHPNIVNIFDVGQEGNIHYIVMELVEGDTLSDVIRETGPLPYQRTIEITKQIAAALGVAHENHIIHRDVKPHNILITNTGAPKITDFGIAKAMNSATIVDTSNGGGVIGSVHYFSPEQARGGYVDEKSDIYSLGIVMYEMLTGRVPFDGDNPVNIALMHINSQMVQPSQLISGIPPALEQIVLKATDKIQTNRYSSAQELIEALDNLQFVGSVVGTSLFMGQGGADDLADPDKPIVETDFDDGEDDDDGYDEDEPKKKDKKPKKKLSKKQKIMIAAIAAAVILGVVAVGAITGLFGGKTAVPNLENKTYARAKEMAEEAGFKVKKGSSVYDDKVKKGKVVSQNPGANQKAKKGSTITLTISKGTEEGTVPDVLEKTQKEAEREIRKAGFKVGDVKTREGEIDKGKVQSQYPEGNTTLPKGSAVDIVISDGSKVKVYVPYVVGDNIDVAKSELEKVGLKMKITYENSEIYSKNTVIEQQYSGQEVYKGTVVALVVSKGENETKSITYTIDFSRAKNDVFYMSVIVEDDSGSRTVVSNQQRYKSDGSEPLMIQGKGSGTVTVIFDGKQVEKKKVNFNTGKVG